MADTLSRLEQHIETINAPVTCEQIAQAQMNDDEINQLRETGYKSYKFSNKQVKPNLSHLCVSFQGQTLPVVPKSIR